MSWNSVMLLAAVSVVAVLVPVAAFVRSGDPKTAIRYAYPEVIDSMWSACLYDMQANLAIPGNVESLYDIAEFTIPLLKTAGWIGNITQLENLALLYNVSLSTVQLASTYVCNMGGSLQNATLDPPVPMWRVGTNPPLEIVLDSAQFIYVLARLLRIIAHIAPEQRTPVLWDFALRFNSLVTEDHLWRWIFGPGAFATHAWGCGNNDYALNHSVFIQMLFDRSFGPGPSYCNAVTDADMWIITSALEILAANEADSSVVSLWPEEKRRLIAYTALGVRLIDSRLVANAANASLPSRTPYFAFDVGAWDQHPDYAYAGYRGTTFPKTPHSKKNTTWDVSHGSRFIHVFDTVDDVASAPWWHAGAATSGPPVQLSHPLPWSPSLARQWARRVFNRNVSFPSFTNFFTFHGWYRVGYDGTGFGYGLGDVGGGTAMSGGYGLLQRVDSEVALVTRSVWELATMDLPSIDGTNGTNVSSSRLAWRAAHIGCMWQDFKRVGYDWSHVGLDLAYAFLMLVPTLWE